MCGSRYLLRADVKGLCLCGRHGLETAARCGLAGIEHDGCGLLCGALEDAVCSYAATDIIETKWGAVNQRGLHWCSYSGRYPNQYGWQKSLSGQCVCVMFLAQSEI